MALLTGTPAGTILTQDELYIDTAPNIYFQDARAGLYYSPDAQGFYWNLTGTTTYPIMTLGCIEGVQLSGNMEMNNIRCDTVGDKGVIQKLAYVDVTCTLKTFFPFSIFSKIIRGGAVTTVSGSSEQFGIGQPNNQQYYHVYMPSVYDPITGDWLAVTMFRGQFVDSWQIAFPYGQQSTVGVTIRCFADDTKPSSQLFGSWFRADPSAIA